MTIKMVATIFYLFISLFSFTNSAFSYSLEWEIGNRFRAFDYLANDDLKKSKELFDNYAPKLCDKETQKHCDIDNPSEENDLSILKWMSDKVIARQMPLSPYSEKKRGPWTEESLNGSGASGYDKKFVTLPEFVLLTLQLSNDTENTLTTESCDIFLGDKKIKTDICLNEITIENYPSTGAKLEFVINGTSIYSAENIKPKLKIILGLGDSYAAGQGAPDIPTVWNKFNISKWPLGDSNLPIINRYVANEGSAQWYSNKCNRSYFSPQSLAALKIARKNPHIIVSFVHLACTGAEVVDGILAPQRKAPGAKTNGCSKKDIKTINSPRKECDLHTSQVTSVARLLCKGKTSLMSEEERKPINDLLDKVITSKYQIKNNWINELETCSKDERIKPDLVLLQVGGNDIGFSSIIQWALAPVEGKTLLSNYVVALGRNKKEVVCPDKKSGNCADNVHTATERLADLPARYNALNFAFKNVLNIDESQVIISGYTNPLFDTNNKLCSNCANKLTENEFWLTKLLIPSGVWPRVWQINFTEYEAGEVLKKIIPQLNLKVSENITGINKWKFADMSEIMNGHGWCVNSDDKDAAYFLNPQKVEYWNGFEDKGRYIRTINDSVLTQWRSDERGILNHFDKEPSVYSDDYFYGAWHPNVQGHAAIADKLYKTSKNLVTE